MRLRRELAPIAERDDRPCPVCEQLRLRLSDRERELSEERAKVRQAVELGFDAMRRGAVAEHEAEKLAALALEREIADLESIRPTDKD